MHSHYVCGQNIQRLGAYAKWPGINPRLPWNVDLSGYQGNLTAAALIGAFQQAWLWWAEAAEINPVMVQTAGEALIRKHFARIDGQNGILAWSELADNTNQPKTQRYDNSELWSVDWFLPAVACHEIGHVLGLEHDNPNSGSLMAPFIQESVKKPTARDIQRLLGLGYAKRTTPIPDPGGQMPANTVRFKTPLAAGDHGSFALGSPVGIGDYMLLLGGDGPPPVVPDDVENRRTLRRLIARARLEGREDAATRIEHAIGTLTIIQIIIALAPFVIGLFSGQPIDWDALIKALLDLFTAHGITA